MHIYQIFIKNRRRKETKLKDHAELLLQKAVRGIACNSLTRCLALAANSTMNLLAKFISLWSISIINLNTSLFYCLLSLISHFHFHFQLSIFNFPLKKARLLPDSVYIKAFALFAQMCIKNRTRKKRTKFKKCALGLVQRTTVQALGQLVSLN